MNQASRLIVCSSATFRGGSDGALYDYLRLHARSEQHVIARFLEPGPAAVDPRWQDLDSKVIDAGRVRQLHLWVNAVRRLRQDIRRFQPQVAVGWTAKEHLYVGTAAVGTKTRSAWFQMGLPGPSNLYRFVNLVPVDGIIACSDYVADCQRKATPKVPVYSVALGADLSRFDPDKLPSMQDARVELGLPKDRPVIGIVGRLQRWKGFHTVVQALPQVLKSHPELCCVFVGGRHEPESSYESELKEVIAKFGLENQIRMVGAQTNVPLWMQAMDVVMHASEREPFGIVVVEAMALGKPVIAAIPGGPAEIIEDGINGYLFPSGDSSILADRIIKLLNDSELRETFSQRAKIRAVNQFSSEAFVNRLSDSLQKIAS